MFYMFFREPSNLTSLCCQKTPITKEVSLWGYWMSPNPAAMGTSNFPRLHSGFQTHFEENAG